MYDFRHMDLKDRIRAAREHSGHTLGAFATKVGVKYETARQWEEGTIKQLRPSRYDRVCQVTGVNRAWLESGAGPMVGDAGNLVGPREIAAAIRRLPTIQDRLAAISEAVDDLRRDGVEPPVE